MREKEQVDTRGLDLRAEHFKTRLNLLINDSNLVPSMILYILKDTTREIQDLYNKAVEYQYNKFCEEAKEQEQQETTQEEKEEDDKNI